MGFAITDMLMQSSLSSAPAKDQPIRRISYYDLVPSEDNFYSCLLYTSDAADE